MNSTCGDTVKCRLDAGKSPIFRSQSPCTYIYIRTGVARLWDFVRIYTYKGTKRLKMAHAQINVRTRACSSTFIVR